MTNTFGYVSVDGYTPVKGETTMISIEELEPGVILEHTTENGERYQYNAPEQAQKYLPEIKVFCVNGGEENAAD